MSYCSDKYPPHDPGGCPDCRITRITDPARFRKRIEILSKLPRSRERDTMIEWQRRELQRLTGRRNAPRRPLRPRAPQLLRVRFRGSRFQAARVAADRAIPFAFAKETGGYTEGLVGLQFKERVKVWAREDGRVVSWERLSAGPNPRRRRKRGRVTSSGKSHHARNPVTEGRILDKLAEASQRVLRGDQGGAAWVWDHMTSEEHLAFDLFLVRTRDPLAWEAGRPEARFKERVRRMVEMERQRRGNPRRGRARHRRNPAARRRAETLIYPDGRIRGTFYGRHRNGKLYKHRFTSAHVAIGGLPDGSIVIHPSRGRLWNTFRV